MVKIVLLPIGSHDRKTAETIENHTFSNFGELSSRISEITGVKNSGSNVRLLELSDFMDMCNDEEFNPDTYWVSYVNIN